MPEHGLGDQDNAHGTQQTVQQAAPGWRVARHRAEIDAAIARVVASGRYILGPECEHFEEEFADFLGVPFVIGVNSGTDAISLALRAVGIEPGQEVIVPAMTAAATAVAVQRAGAVVRIVDVEHGTRGLSPEAFSRAISARTAAVVVVHLHGTPALLPEICRIAHKHNLVVIEDCAQAHGASIDGRLVGTLADAAAFSFYPTKNLGALGDAGAVAVRSGDIAERVRRLRNYGGSAGGFTEGGATNSRLDEIQDAAPTAHARQRATPIPCTSLRRCVGAVRGPRTAQIAAVCPGRRLSSICDRSFRPRQGRQRLAGARRADRRPLCGRSPPLSRVRPDDGSPGLPGRGTAGVHIAESANPTGNHGAPAARNRRVERGSLMPPVPIGRQLQLTRFFL
jgi:DegT/DnrJ/EryC1/StrS aminotransferase family